MDFFPYLRVLREFFFIPSTSPPPPSKVKWLISCYMELILRHLCQMMRILSPSKIRVLDGVFLYGGGGRGLLWHFQCC